ncbi:MAG: hypothetical protein GY861_12580 [bacterium]|nr:hypothetical protein [bacterium]
MSKNLTIAEMRKQAEWMKEKGIKGIEYYMLKTDTKVFLIPFPAQNKIFETPILEVKAYEE